MLFSNTDIEKAVRKGLGEFNKPCAFRHGSSDGNQFVMAMAKPDHLRPEDFSI